MPDNQTIGSIITATAAAQSTAAASAAAAIAADSQAKADAAGVVTAQKTLADDLALTGPITVLNNDGTFVTYQTSTTAPFYSTEISQGVNVVVPTVTPALAPVA